MRHWGRSPLHCAFAVRGKECWKLLPVLLFPTGKCAPQVPARHHQFLRLDAPHHALVSRWVSASFWTNFILFFSRAFLSWIANFSFFIFSVKERIAFMRFVCGCRRSGLAWRAASARRLFAFSAVTSGTIPLHVPSWRGGRKNARTTARPATGFPPIPKSAPRVMRRLRRTADAITSVRI